MNILYVNTANRGGGAEKVAMQIYQGMKSDNLYNCFFLSGYGKVADNSSFVVFDTNNKVRESTWLGKAQSNQPYVVKRTRRRILELIKKYRIDIVHFHNIHGNYLGIKDIEYISRFCKIVWTLHDMWAVTGHCAYAFECIQWKEKNCKRCENKNVYPELVYNDAHIKYKIKQKTFANADIHFVVPSIWLKSILEESFLKDRQVTVINNGVNCTEFTNYNKKILRKKYGIAEDRRVMLFGAANVSNAFKGIDYLYKALECIESKQKYTLLVVGKGLDQYRISKEFEVKSFGYVSDTSKMNEIYALADLFLITSVAENFPCVVLEAMASGTPTLAFATGGIIEQVIPDVGWLVETRKYEQFASRIEEIYQDRDLLVEKGKKSREYAEAVFSEEKMISKYKVLYESII